MRSLLRFAAVAGLAFGFAVSAPAADSTTKKSKKKKADCSECCKDGKCAKTSAMFDCKEATNKS